MKFKYIKEEPAETTVYGINFVSGDAVDVSEEQVLKYKTGDVKVVDKLKGNPCFELVEDKKEPVKVEEEKPKRKRRTKAQIEADEKEVSTDTASE